MGSKKYYTMEEKIEAIKLANQKYEHTLKGRATKQRNRVLPPRKVVDFIAWDGEGIDVGGEHRYALLVHSKSNEGWMYNYSGLSTLECFDMLTGIAYQYPKAVHVAFSSGYDVNMMLRDIPRDKLEILHTKKRLYYKNYSIEYTPKKYLTLKRYPEDMFIHKGKRKAIASITLWDVFGFFQQSFLSTLDTFFSKEEKELLQYSQIAVGKEARGTFREDQIEEFVLPYCKLEVKALVALMNTLYNEYCRDLGVTLRRFDGSGAISHFYLDKHKVKEHYGEAPYEVMLASQFAYGGGRIEALKFGHYEGFIEHDDIVSCYPDQQRKLWSLKNGVWVHHTDGNILSNGNTLPFPRDCSVTLVEWDYSDTDVVEYPFMPFFYRNWPQGSITYPTKGRNWVWYPELQIALKYLDRMKGKIRLLEQWQFVPSEEIEYPYTFILEMFEHRKRLKAEGKGMEKALKLAYNGFYGKTVQHVGYEDHMRRGQKNWRPPFFNLQYGGMITSGARAKLFDAAMQSPSNIIAFATDGLWSLVPLDLPKSTSLGDWEYAELKSGTFCGSGVYWTHDTYNKVTTHYRGFDKGTLREENVIDAWASQYKPTLEIPSTRFVTLGMGLQLKDISKWRTWDTSLRELNLYPVDGNSKRATIIDTMSMSPHLGLVPTIPQDGKTYQRGHKNFIMSEPFPLPWTVERQEYDDSRISINLNDAIIEATEEKYY